MDAAVRLAARRGFSRTRVSDIVGRVGVGQGVFYWYFESKQALFEEILADTTRRIRHFQGAYISSEPDPVRRIAKGIVATFEFVGRNRHVFAFIDHASVETRWREWQTEATRIHVLDAVRHLEEAAAEGLIRSGDPTYLAQGITGTLDRMARTFFVRRDKELDEVTQDAIDFCLGGLLYANVLRVADLRDEVELTPELEDLRDRVGAGTLDPVEP